MITIITSKTMMTSYCFPAALDPSHEDLYVTATALVGWEVERRGWGRGVFCLCLGLEPCSRLACYMGLAVHSVPTRLSHDTRISHLFYPALHYFHLHDCSVFVLDWLQIYYAGLCCRVRATGPCSYLAHCSAGVEAEAVSKTGCYQTVTLNLPIAEKTTRHEK